MNRVEFERLEIREVMFGIMRLENNLNSLRFRVKDIWVIDNWHAQQNAQIVGMSVQYLLEKTYEAIQPSVSEVPSIEQLRSAPLNSEQAFWASELKRSIFEELNELIRLGILMRGRLKRDSPNLRKLDYVDSDEYILLTDYGLVQLQEEVISPLFHSKYISSLEASSPLDDDLKGYLVEGLNCLHHRLDRAAILLLRLATQHTLESLADAVINALPEGEGRNRFISKIASATRGRTKLQEYGDAVFKQLESGGLLDEAGEIKRQVSQQLQPAFHAIRHLGGKAAHLSVSIDRVEVSGLFTLYATCIYRITAQVINYLDKPS